MLLCKNINYFKANIYTFYLINAILPSLSFVARNTGFKPGSAKLTFESAQKAVRALTRAQSFSP